MSIINNETLTPREHILLEKETEENRLARQHAMVMKKLEIEDHKQQLKLKLADAQLSRKAQEQRLKLELEVRKVEAHAAQLWRIPITLIKLPVFILYGFGFIISVARNKEINTNFWNILK